MMMNRNLSPVLRRELANLDKDSDSRKSAMKALKSYVKDLDSKAIPVFLAQVSETKETGSLSGEYTISLYEVLARVHGPKIVPQIDSIMSTITKTLASSAGSFPLQQACSKVVPAIARYGIDPTTPEDRKRHIIHSLCSPLSESLLGSQESLTSGAALCLKALVESDNWRFASDEEVNKVCQNAAAALEGKSTQTNAHMGLVMALAKHNAFIVEAYVRLLIQSGLKIAGAAEGNSQKRFSAIQMINFLMKCLDPRSMYSEIELIIEEIEKCQSDQMAYVKGAAYETLLTAKKIQGDKGSKFENSCGSVTGSNFGRKDHSRRINLSSAGDQSPVSISPESQTLDSFLDDSFLESPHSLTQSSYDNGFDRRSVNRKLWRHENGGVDVSLKDGLFSEVPSGGFIFDLASEPHELTENGDECIEEFTGFIQSNARNGFQRCYSPSPQRSRSHINVDNINLFTTPRKLIRSLQDHDDDAELSEKHTRLFKTPSSEKFEHKTSDQNGSWHGKPCRRKGNTCSWNSNKQYEGASESVSSTEDDPAVNVVQQPCHTVPQNKFGTSKSCNVKGRPQKCASRMVVGFFFIVLALFTSLLWTDFQDQGYYLVPT